MAELSGGGSREARLSSRRGWAVAIALGFVVTGVLNVVVVSGSSLGGNPPSDVATADWAPDFDLNWVAAHRLVDGEPLYDRDSAAADRSRMIGRQPLLDTGTFTSFIGSPATALVYLPYLVVDHDDALRSFRLVSLLLMLTAVVITAFALPVGSRLFGALVGLGACLWSFPVASAIGLGQVDGVVMVALAAAIWAASNRRWRIVGVGLAIAAVLKVSPVLLLVFLVIRGFRKVIVPALLTGVALVAVATAIGRSDDTWHWATDVAPQLSRGSLIPQNQSLPGYAARLVTSGGDWSSVEPLSAGWRPMSWAVAIAGLALVWWVRRGCEFHPLELGAVIFIALLTGPITWDHYLSWAVLPLVLMTEPALWARAPVWRRAVAAACIGAGVALSRVPVLDVPSHTGGEEPWSKRLLSGHLTVALASLLAAGLLLMASRQRVDRSEYAGGLEGRSPHSPTAGRRGRTRDLGPADPARRVTGGS